MDLRRLGTAALAAAALTAACATTPRVEKLSTAPQLETAEGRVRLGRLADDQTSVELEVRSLPEPDKLNPPGYAYVAWARSSPTADALNLGALNLDENNDGELKVKTPLRNFEVFVTVEPAADAERPTGPPVLWTGRPPEQMAKD